MRVRGDRECNECGQRWSYFETGTIACPNCGSHHSVGRGERRRHTDGEQSLDLSVSIEKAASGSVEAALESALDPCRSYVHSRGFIAGGELTELDDLYCLAAELRYCAGARVHRSAFTDLERRYLLALFGAAADGQRPMPSAVPDRFRFARGLAVARSVTDYQRAIRQVMAVDDREASVATALDALDGVTTRIEQLDGDVPPASAETVLEAARTVGSAVRSGDADAVEGIPNRLERLEWSV